MHDNSPEAIRKETRVYLVVFATLAILTVVTVAVSRMEHSATAGLVLALVIASVKGFLVAGYFMHLLNEKKLIYSILALTMVFFAVLLWIPFAEAGY